MNEDLPEVGLTRAHTASEATRGEDNSLTRKQAIQFLLKKKETEERYYKYSIYSCVSQPSIPFSPTTIPSRSTSIDTTNPKAVRFYQKNPSKVQPSPALVKKVVPIRPPKDLPPIPYSENSAPIIFPKRSTSIKRGNAEKIESADKETEKEKRKKKSMSNSHSRVEGERVGKRSSGRKASNADTADTVKDADDHIPPAKQGNDESFFDSIHDHYDFIVDESKKTPLKLNDKYQPASLNSSNTSLHSGERKSRPISSRSRALQLSSQPPPQIQRRGVIWSGIVSTPLSTHRLFLFTDLLLETIVSNDLYTITKLVPLSKCEASYSPESRDIKVITWDNDEFETSVYTLKSEGVARDVYNYFMMLASEGGDDLVEDCAEVAELVAGEVFEREELEEWCCDL